jgi:hypothetical protein
VANVDTAKTRSNPATDVGPIGRVFNTFVAARISLGLIVLGSAVLFLPQGTDVLRGLVEDTNFYIHGGEGAAAPVGQLFFQWAAFVIACIWTGLNAWYWPRILFRQRVKGQTPHWFKVILRITGLLPLSAGFITLLLIADSPSGFRPREVWIGLVVLTVSILLLAAFFVRREHIFSSSKSWYSKPSSILDRRNRRRSGRDPRLNRGDDAFFLVSLAFGIVMVALLSTPGVRTWVSQGLGSAALAFGAIGMLIAFFSTIAWSFGRLRMPVLPAILVVFAAFGFSNDNHAVRVMGNHNIGTRPDLSAALSRWEAENPDGPLILVAASGGASRAGYWTAAVLRELDRRTAGAFGRHVFAISAVSGGSLGAVGYAARLADVGGAGRCHDPDAERRFDQTFVGGDYLAPAVGGLLYPDLLQRFLPLPVFYDRASSLEEAWEIGWQRASVALGALGRCGDRRASDRLAGDFDAIWRESLAGKSGWVPLVFVNGTLVENGKRVITAPVRVDSRVFEDSYDFYELVDRPIRASTAILNGARFPVVSPAGTLQGSKPHGRIVDGGYFEDGGLETMLDLARFLHLRPNGSRRKMVLIEIDNSLPTDTEEVLADLQRYPNFGSDAAVLNTALAVEAPPVDGAPPLSEVTSIVGGLYGTRTSRGVLAAKRLSGLQAIGLHPNVSRITFNLLRRGNGAAMSWTLSRGSRIEIDRLIGTEDELDQSARSKAGDRPLSRCQREVADRLATLLGAAVAPPQGCRQNTLTAAAVGLPI